MSQPLTSSLDWTGHWSFADATPSLGRQVTLAQPKASSQGYRPKRADRSSNPGQGPKLQGQPQTLAGSTMSQPLTSSLDWTGHWSFADATPSLGRQVTLAQPKASSQGYRPKRADQLSNPGQGPRLQGQPQTLVSLQVSSSLDWTGHWSFADATPRRGRQVTLAQPKASSQGYRPKRADQLSNPGQGPRLQGQPQTLVSLQVFRSPAKYLQTTADSRLGASGVPSQAYRPVGRPRQHLFLVDPVSG